MTMIPTYDAAPRPYAFDLNAAPRGRPRGVYCFLSVYWIAYRSSSALVLKFSFSLMCSRCASTVFGLTNSISATWRTANPCPRS